MKVKFLVLFALLLVGNINFVLGAHYIVGYVENAKDGESANGKSVLLWNPLNGMLDNVSDIVGVGGNSGADNIYMIDCEMLSSPCNVGDILSLKIVNGGDDYVSAIKNVSVTGAGFTIAENITLNSIPVIMYIEIDDDFLPPEFPLGEIDLTAGDKKNIFCKAIIVEYDGAGSLESARGEFFHESSGYGNPNHNNNHYSNNSCYINSSYGENNEAEITCIFDVWYYSNPGIWTCDVEITDNLSISSRETNTTNINELLAIYIDDEINFGTFSAMQVTDEKELIVVNYGNIMINLSLSGYGVEEGDDLAMSCISGEIPVYYKKYNLSSSNSGEMNLEEFELKYKNLTKETVVSEFNLDYRKNEIENDALNSTYWRVYVPEGVGGSCQGNIVFGARKEVAD
jgi:hypothetical protein